MRNLNLSLVFAIIIIGVFVTGCASLSTDTVSHGSVVIDYVSFVDSLQGKGLTVEPVGVVEQPFFNPNGNMLKVDGHDIQVFEFSTAEEADAAAETISEDGSVVGSSIMMWLGPPHFFKADKLIVLYVGEDDDIVDSLRELLGPQIAGR